MDNEADNGTIELLRQIKQRNRKLYFELDGRNIELDSDLAFFLRTTTVEGKGIVTNEKLRQWLNEADRAYLTAEEAAKELLEVGRDIAEYDEPPKSAEYLAYLFLQKADRETLLGDLTEEYPGIVAKFGAKWARIYFYKQVVWSIWPLVRKALIKWGLFGWAVEYIRRKIGF